MTKREAPIYKVIFLNQGQVFEMYAKQIYSIAVRRTTLGSNGYDPYNARFFESLDEHPWPRSFTSKPTVAR